MAPSINNYLCQAKGEAEEKGLFRPSVLFQPSFYEPSEDKTI